MVERATLGEAAGALSERIRDMGGELAPEFDANDPVGTPEEQDPDRVGTPETEEEPESETLGTESDEDGRFALPETAAELAEALGIDVADLYSLKMSVDVGDNQSQTYTLEELKALGTGPARDEAERVRWQDQRRAQEAELRAERETLNARRRDADTLASVVFGQLNTAEQQATEAYSALLSNVEFQGRDPQGYQVELLRQRARLEDVQRQKQGLMAQMDTVRQQMANEQEQAIEKAREAGAKRLREYIPEWSEDGAFSEGAQALRSYVQQERFGVTDEELQQTLDPRVFYWAEMARRYEALQQQAQERPAPKPTATLRPGAPQVRLPRGRRAEIEAMERLKGSGSIDDARSVLANRLRQTG